MRILYKLTVFLLVGFLLSCKSDLYISDQAKTKEIIIYHTPFHIKLKRGIRYNEIEERCSHIIKINPKQNDYFSHFAELRYAIESLEFLEPINPDSLIVRTKIIFSFKKSKRDKIIYFLEDRSIVIGNKRYNKSNLLLALIDLNCTF